METEANFRNQVLQALFLPPFLFCILSAICFGLVVHLLFALERVGRTDRLISRANATSRLLDDRATALRGYLVADSPVSLRAYREVDDQLGSCFDEMARLMPADPLRSNRLNRLREQSELWGRNASETMSLHLRASSRGQDIEDAVGGQERMNQLHNSMREFLKAEEDDRSQWISATGSRSWTILAAVFGAAIILGSLFIYTSRRHLNKLYGVFGGTLEVLQAKLDRQELDTLTLLSEAMKYYAIFKLDSEGKILSWNAESERILGYRADDILGRRPTCFYSPDDVKKDSLYHDLEWALLEGRVEDERFLTRKDGFRFKARVTLAANRDPNGALRGYTSVIHEIEDQRS